MDSYERRLTEEFAEWVYRFRIETSINYDGQYLVVCRNRYVDGEWQSEWLTRDGWEPYAEFESFDYSKMISMSGLEMHRERDIVKRVTKEMHRAMVKMADGQVERVRAET